VANSNGLTKGTPGDSKSICLLTNDLDDEVSVGGKSWLDWRLLIGDTFGVDSLGNMVCTTGYIGGWDIDSANIHKGDVYLYSAD
jgi:hypothetical protein